MKLQYRTAALGAWILMALAAGTQAQSLDVGPLRWLPGNAVDGPSVQLQDRPSIAAGGSGYLAVWQDQRTILRGAPNTPGEPLLGTSQDIYAARLDAAGRRIGSPFAISHGAHIQSVPKVAWNGQSWLVAFITTRPDNYYNTDLVAVRVAPDGRLLDPRPILVDPQTDNNAPSNLAVASDGSGWAVVWEEFNASGVRGVQGTRIGADGAVANLGGKPIHFDSYNLYAHDIAIAFAGDRYLVTWCQSSPNVVRGKLLTAGLDVLGGAFVIDNYSYTDAERPDVASDGVEFFVAWHEKINVNQSQLFGARVSRTGQVLDPAGIQLGNPEWGTYLSPAVVWDGVSYTVAWNQAGTAGQDLVYRRVGRDGRPLGLAATLASHAVYEDTPALASAGDGSAQAVWSASLSTSGTHKDDVYAASIGADGTVTTPVPVSTGKPRQISARMATHPAGHLAVFLSEVSGQTRVMAQRLDAAGNALDPEPVVVASGTEGALSRPDVAWNGSVYLVIWQGLEGILGRRLAASAAPVDATPQVLFAGADWSQPAVGALASDFLVVGTKYTNYSTVRENALQGVRVSGDGRVLDAPFLIRAGWNNDPRVTALGGNWLVVLEAQTSHSASSSSIRGSFVTPAGSPGASFLFHPYGSDCTMGCGDDPDVAVQGDTAMVVWSDNGTFNNAKIEARLIKADGTFPGPEIEVVQAAGDQFFPAVAEDGNGGWVVGWADYRTSDMVRQFRADVYVARVGAAGGVLDAGGVPVSSGPLSELQPRLAPVPGAAGAALLAYSLLDPLAPVTYRIGLRTLGGGAGTEPPPPPPPPSAIASLTLSPASVVGGKISTATVTLASPAPSTGAKVTLTSANTAVATVPVSVTVAAGTTSRTFAVTSRPVASATAVGISASYAGATKTAALTVEPPVLSGLTLSPATFTGGCQGSTGKVILSGKAPVGGSGVALTNTNPAATVPSSVTVPAGATYATFAITAPAVSALQTGTVGASFGGVARSVTLKVQPVGLQTLTLAPNPVVGPNSVTGTVTLTCAAPAGGTVVALSSGTAAVARPAVASLTIPAGSTGGTFTVTTADVSAVSYATIKAVAGGVTKTVRLTVNP